MKRVHIVKRVSTKILSITFVFNIASNKKCSSLGKPHILWANPHIRMISEGSVILKTAENSALITGINYI